MKNVKLKYKLALLYMVTGLLPVVMLFTFTYVQMRKILMEKDTKTIQTFLYQTTSGMDNQIEIYDNLSNYVSFNETISKIVSYDYKSNYEMYTQFVQIMDPMLSSLKYFHEDVNQVTIYMDNDIKHDTTIAPISEISDADWFQDACQDSNIKWYADNDRHALFSVRKMPILYREDMLGILYINVDYDRLFNSYTENIDDNYGIFVTDGNGNKVYEYNRFSDKYADMRLDFDTFMNIGKSTEYTIISQSSKNTDWVVWMYKPKSLIIRSVQPIILIMVVAIVLVISAAIIAILSSSKFITKRIEKLKNNMQEVENGDFAITVNSDSNDEIGELIDGFGNMIGQIQNLISEVYEGKISQKEYEMKALRAQINPHFLYNSLSLINWKALEAGQSDISQITLALSNYYRTSLNKGKNVLSLEMELSNMKSYMQIQSIMHDNEFDVIIDVDDEIKQYESLNLILQPLIENAIDHGIDVKTDGKGIITVTGRMNHNIIYLTVEDNGVGMDKHTLETFLSTNSSGYGAKNVNERIKLYYGEEYEMQVESELNKGTKITIRFPAHKMNRTTT